jgi:AcrR family transcriptional regulator
MIPHNALQSPGQMKKKPAKAENKIPAKRRYDSPLRRQQAAETRERIVAAGASLVHGYVAWDWTNLTAQAVGERAGISERTVHRYFPTERKLRDAVLQRLYEESGVELDDLELGQFADVTARLFNYLSTFSTAPATVDDPSLASMDQQRRDALLKSVVRATPDWSDRDRTSAAAVLDILWNQPPYERLIMAWGFDNERATAAITWVIGLIEEAIREGRRPDGT